MSVVAITGISGCVGRNLLTQFDVDEDVEQVIGIDRSPAPPEACEKLTFYQRDIGEPLEDVFTKHGVRMAVHLATSDDRTLERDPDVDVRMTESFLRACGAAEVESLCVLSTATIYGAHPDNEILLEGSLLSESRYPPARSKARIEDLCYTYVKDYPKTALQILRPMPILGPTSSSVFTRMLEGKRILAPSSGDPLLQFVHEDDVTRAIHRLVKSGCFGVFNLAGDGPLHLSQVAQLAERRLVRLPLALLRGLAWLTYKLGMSDVHPGFVDYLVHPWLVAAMKIRNQAYFMSRYDSADALLDYLEHRSGHLPVPAGPSPLLESIASDVLSVDGFAAALDSPVWRSPGGETDEGADDVEEADFVDELDDEGDEDGLDELDLDEEGEEDEDSFVDQAETGADDAGPLDESSGELPAFVSSAPDSDDEKLEPLSDSDVVGLQSEAPDDGSEDELDETSPADPVSEEDLDDPGETEEGTDKEGADATDPGSAEADASDPAPGTAEPTGEDEIDPAGSDEVLASKSEPGPSSDQ